MSIHRPSSSAALWVVQGLLAALFLFAGGAKLAMPMATLGRLSPLPAGFLNFIAVCEALGGLGMVLPGLFRIRPRLTALAAAGLVIIMIGAVIVTVMTQGALPAAFPFAVGLLAAAVAIGRRQWRLAPRTQTAARTAGPRVESHGTRST